MRGILVALVLLLTGGGQSAQAGEHLITVMLYSHHFTGATNSTDYSNNKQSNKTVSKGRQPPRISQPAQDGQALLGDPVTNGNTFGAGYEYRASNGFIGNIGAYQNSFDSLSLYTAAGYLHRASKTFKLGVIFGPVTGYSDIKYIGGFIAEFNSHRLIINHNILNYSFIVNIN